MLTAIIGFLSGILGGMGVGGGMILIPAATIFLDLDQQTAQSLNLFCFIPSALCALAIHIKNKKVDFKVAFSIILTGIPLAIAGAYLSTKLPSPLLSKLFGGFILIFGVKEIITGIKSPKNSTSS